MTDKWADFQETEIFQAIGGDTHDVVEAFEKLEGFVYDEHVDCYADAVHNDLQTIALAKKILEAAERRLTRISTAWHEYDRDY